MRFTVVWAPAALGDLADAWTRAADRAAVAIDRTLLTDPDQKGVAFYGDRLLVVAPLQAVFTVHPDDRLVRVEYLL
jgi:hypothetical protein